MYVCVLRSDIMYSLYPWRDKEWFTEQFIQKDTSSINLSK